MIVSEKIGLGGSCHWCTEAIFQSLKGVQQVSQGWISSKDSPTRFSEAVMVEFDSAQISLQTLIEIHLKLGKMLVILSPFYGMARH